MQSHRKENAWHHLGGTDALAIVDVEILADARGGFVSFRGEKSAKLGGIWRGFEHHHN